MSNNNPSVLLFSINLWHQVIFTASILGEYFMCQCPCNICQCQCLFSWNINSSADVAYLYKVQFFEYTINKYYPEHQIKNVILYSYVDCKVFHIWDLICSSVINTWHLLHFLLTLYTIFLNMYLQTAKFPLYSYK
jgi:hypothetical protein